MKQTQQNRRDFLKCAAAATAMVGIGALPAITTTVARGADKETKDVLFKISLAQWSFNKALFNKKMDHLDFAKTAKGLGIDAVEYVNQFFKDKAKDEKYLAEMKKRAEDLGVKSLLIMCDGEGNLGDPDGKKRTQAVENHYKWVEAGKFLGCHSIRVNAASSGSYEEQVKLAADGLRRLSEFADKYGLNVIVENHGGLSSNGAWLATVMKTANHPRCGTLPDFGNFRVSRTEEYDRYKGIDELMPFAKGVSAKSHDFDESGNETHTDYNKMMEIVCVKHGYRGYVGIEYEGSRISEQEGVVATKKLLERVRTTLSAKA